MTRAVAWSTRTASRRRHAVEALGSAAEAIGPIEAGLSVFVVLRGQFSLVDMVHHVIRSIGPSAVAIWTWALAEYEVEMLGGLMADRAILSGRLIVNRSAEHSGRRPMVEAWVRRFGPDSLRVCQNHAKMARVWSGDRRVLIRGSMNLNCNQRFEQADITEGGPEFDLVAGLEDTLPALGLDTSWAEADTASGVSQASGLYEFGQASGIKPWAK